MACGLWIIYFLVRYGRSSAPANPEQDFNAYRRALVERYDHQIQLLKSVKYWYLLPLWIGLMLGSTGMVLSGSPERPSWLVRHPGARNLYRSMCVHLVAQ
jgi:hypothetical protein